MAKQKTPRQPSPRWSFPKMDKYMQLQLALSAVILALVLPLYHPLETIQNLRQSTPFATPSDLPVPPKLKTLSPQVRFMSYDPLIAHLTDFVSPEERQYLLKLSKPLLRKSQVTLVNGTKVDSEGRTSSTAFLTKTDVVVKHILERASEFQGYLPVEQMDMQVTAYQQGQEFRPHFDWFAQPDRNKRNRFSTFFAILEANCENCGTQFPQIRLDPQTLDPRWCGSINCTQDVFTSLNSPGGAVFWRNLDPWGRPRQDVLHAGLPAINGTKIGLNIWTEIPVNPEWYPPVGESDASTATVDAAQKDATQDAADETAQGKTLEQGKDTSAQETSPEPEKQLRVAADYGQHQNVPIPAVPEQQSQQQHTLNA